VVGEGAAHVAGADRDAVVVEHQLQQFAGVKTVHDARRCA
jgi:hypothetical protein